MKITWKNCLRIGVSIFVLYLCIFYWQSVSAFIGSAIGAATPIFVGLGIAYVLNILMTGYEKHYFPKHSNKKIVSKTRRGVCIFLSIITLLAIIAVVVWLVVPELISTVTFLVSEIPILIEEALTTEWAQKILPEDILASLSSIDWAAYIEKIIDTLGSSLGSAVNMVVSAVTSVLSVTITIFISIIFSVYLLYSKDKMLGQGMRMLNNYVPARITDRIVHWLRVFNESFRGYIVGQCTEAIILGVLCTIGMYIFRFPYAAMIGAFIAFTALIPIAGAYIGAAVGALMMLTESPIKALLFIVFIIVLQQLEGNLIFPKVVGKSIGLPAFWVLAAVTIGGGIFGVLGMIIGVPITAALYRLIREDVNRREAAAKPPKPEE
ncbi:MAG: AI-2E family transporter [Clostridia bacterium]|nr:AI-2E family transporter [Clostridia bacterium]